MGKSVTKAQKQQREHQHWVCVVVALMAQKLGEHGYHPPDSQTITTVTIEAAEKFVSWFEHNARRGAVTDDDWLELAYDACQELLDRDDIRPHCFVNDIFHYERKTSLAGESAS